MTVSYSVVAEPVWHYEPGHYGNRYFERYVEVFNTIVCQHVALHENLLYKLVKSFRKL